MRETEKDEDPILKYRGGHDRPTGKMVWTGPYELVKQALIEAGHYGYAARMKRNGDVRYMLIIDITSDPSEDAVILTETGRNVRSA